MKKVLLGCAGLLAVIVVVACAGAYYAAQTYGYFRAPRLTYLDVIGPGYPIRVVCEPGLVKDQLATFAGQQAFALPPFLLNRALPYELALLADLDAKSQTLSVHLFVNEQAFGPVMKKQLDVNFAATMNGAVQWSETGFDFPRRGELTLTGELKIAQEIVSTARKQWGTPERRRDMPMEGGHFLEVLADNRDGLLFILLHAALDPTGASLARIEAGPDASIQRTPQQQMQDIQLQLLGNTIKQIERIQCHADPAPDDALSVHLTVACTPRSGRAGPESVKTLLDTSFIQSISTIESLYGVRLSGSSAIKGSNVEAEYRLEPFSKLLEQMAQPR